jgi:hypothetical protein
MVHKMGWCFTCGADDCQHIRNTTQELINALQYGVAFAKNGKTISADDVYLDPPLEARGLEIREKGQ